MGGGVTWSYLGEEVQKTWWTVLIWIFLFVRTLRLKVRCFGGLYPYLLGVIKSKCFNWWLTVTENLTYFCELYFFLDGHCWTFSVSLLGVIFFYFISYIESSDERLCLKKMAREMMYRLRLWHLNQLVFPPQFSKRYICLRVHLLLLFCTALPCLEA